MVNHFITKRKKIKMWSFFFWLSLVLLPTKVVEVSVNIFRKQHVVKSQKDKHLVNKEFVTGKRKKQTHTHTIKTYYPV